MHRRLGLALLLLALAAAGCDAQTGSPQPMPIPSPQLLRASGAIAAEPEPIVLVGLPGAVAGSGTVYVSHDSEAWSAHSSDLGSFHLRLTAGANQVLEIRFEDSLPAQYTVQELGIQIPVPPQPIAGVSPIVAAGDGKVTIRGQVSQAGSAVFAVNLDTGAVGLATSDASSQFSIQLEAQPGAAVEVYEDGDPLGPSWDLVAP